MSEADPSDLSNTGYEAAEEERKSLEEERGGSSITGPTEKEESREENEDPTRGQGSERKARRRTTPAIGAAAPGRQMTLFDLDKQLDKQRRLMERMADDVKHLRKQFNQVQRDLAKFEKRLGKTKTSPSAKRGRGSRNTAS